MTFVLHTQHEEVVLQRARREVKLQKLSLLPGGVLSLSRPLWE